MPSATKTALLYLDASCSEVVTYVRPTESCPQPVVPAYVGSTSTGCRSEVDDGAPGRRRDQSEQALCEAGDTCSQASVSDEYRYFETSAVDAAAFVGAAEELD